MDGLQSGFFFFAGGENELWNGKAKLFQDKTVGGELALLTESEVELGFLWKSLRVLLFFWSRPHMHQIPHPGCEGKMLYLKVSIAGLSMKELVEAYWSSGQNVNVCSSHKHTPFLSLENLKGGVRALPINSLGPEIFSSPFFEHKCHFKIIAHLLLLKPNFQLLFPFFS